MGATPEELMDEPKLGDRVTFTGIVEKSRERWRRVSYKETPLPAFEGWLWAQGRTGTTRHPRNEGIVVGKRVYVSMENDDGLWVADGVQKFTAYLVAYHLRRNPVIVRLDQMTGFFRSQPTVTTEQANATRVNLVSELDAVLYDGGSGMLGGSPQWDDYLSDVADAILAKFTVTRPSTPTAEQENSNGTEQ
jgi:hypothetical protein